MFKVTSWAVLWLGQSWFEEFFLLSYSGDVKIRLILVMKEVLLNAWE